MRQLSGTGLTGAFSLLKHHGGEIALTEFNLDTYCVSEYKLK